MNLGVAGGGNAQCGLQWSHKILMYSAFELNAVHCVPGRAEQIIES